MSEFEKMLAGKDFDGGADCINHIRQNASNLLQAIIPKLPQDAGFRVNSAHSILGK